MKESNIIDISLKLTSQICCNDSAGLCIYCTDRKNVMQECKNLIAEGNFKWIFACNCEGTEQLRYAIEKGFGGRMMNNSYIISKMNEFMFQFNGKMGHG